MTTPAANFNDKAAAPALIEPAAYQALLEKLLAEGKGYGKTKNVGAYFLRDIKFVTEMSDGQSETEVNIKVEKRYIIMDLDQFRSEAVRRLVVEDTAKRWAHKLVGLRDQNSPDFKGAGLWTNKQDSFEFDYLKQDAKDGLSSVWVPNPEAYRVTLAVQDPVCIPCTWGDFTVKKGGTLAVRERDVKELAAALLSIKMGEQTPEQALYAKNEEGKTVAKFDVYGMEPKFRENNYDPISLKPETLAITKAFEPSTHISVTKAAPKTSI